jgi:hypothetical protein
VNNQEDLQQECKVDMIDQALPDARKALALRDDNLHVEVAAVG